MGAARLSDVRVPSDRASMLMIAGGDSQRAQRRSCRFARREPPRERARCLQLQGVLNSAFLIRLLRAYCKAVLLNGRGLGHHVGHDRSCMYIVQMLYETESLVDWYLHECNVACQRAATSSSSVRRRPLARASWTERRALTEGPR